MEKVKSIGEFRDYLIGQKEGLQFALDMTNIQVKSLQNSITMIEEKLKNFEKIGGYQMKIVSDKEYMEKMCKNCKNKKSNLCEIKRLLDNSVNCVYYEDTKEKGE